MSGDVQVRFCEGLGARFPGPTHLVAMCRTESQAREALRRIGLVMDRLGLKLHPAKTRMVDLRRGKESLVFLGCTIRKKRSIQRNPRGGTCSGGEPKATQRHRDRVREITGPRAAGKDLKALIGDLNPVLRGWGNYFEAEWAFWAVASATRPTKIRAGNADREFNRMDGFVYRRLTGWLHGGVK